MQSKLLNKNFLLILLANALLGAPMPMLIILGGLAGLSLAPHESLATVPVSVQVMAGLLSAAPMSVFMAKHGRKLGFYVGVMSASLGGIVAALGIFYSSFWLLSAGHAFLGLALVCFGYFRFAAAETVDDDWKPVAISFALGSGLVAAIIGPEIFNQTRSLFSDFAFAGSYLAITAIAAVGIVPLMLLNLPTNSASNEQKKQMTSAMSAVWSRPAILGSIFCGAGAYAIMTLLMTPTPLAMVSLGFHEHSASDVIRWHVIAMFAPSFITGFLISKFGVSTIVFFGIITLAASSIIAAIGVSGMHFYVSLILLGIGWNFGFIGGTTMLASFADEHQKGAIQGINDTLVALASTVASFGSGVLMSSVGWAGTSLAAFPLIALALFGLYLTRSESAQAQRHV